MIGLSRAHTKVWPYASMLLEAQDAVDAALHAWLDLPDWADESAAWDVYRAACYAADRIWNLMDGSVECMD